MKYYDQENQRLVFTSESATPAYWDRRWEEYGLEHRANNAIGNDHFVYPATRKFIKPDQTKRILEGGCGLGLYVASLTARGYDTYGVDFAKRTVDKVTSTFPHLKITVGNVEKLPFTDNYFDGYWSLGVIEHFYHGYNLALSEMRRVIRPGGLLFITFPHFSPLRKIKSFFHCYPLLRQATFSETSFYQFALNGKKVRNNIEAAGFKRVYSRPLDGIKGLKDEVGWLRPCLQRMYNSDILPVRIACAILSRILAPLSGHALFYVFRRNQ